MTQSGQLMTSAREDEIVKLSSRELKLVEGMGRLHQQKMKGLVGIVIVLAVYWVLRYVGVLSSVEIPIDTLLIVYAAIQIGNSYSVFQPEDRYVELLRRYVNSDSEAITALAERNKQ